MIKSSLHFQYEIPDSWNEYIDNNKYIYQGHNQEELTISGVSVDGTGPHDELLLIREKIFSNAVQSVHYAADHPDLQIEGTLSELSGTQLPIWIHSSITKDHQTVFLQAIIYGNLSLLLVTFEALNNYSARSFFDAFLKSVVSDQN